MPEILYIARSGTTECERLRRISMHSKVSFEHTTERGKKIVTPVAGHVYHPAWEPLAALDYLTKNGMRQMRVLGRYLAHTIPRSLDDVAFVGSTSYSNVESIQTVAASADLKLDGDNCILSQAFNEMVPSDVIGRSIQTHRLDGKTPYAFKRHLKLEEIAKKTHESIRAITERSDKKILITLLPHYIAQGLAAMICSARSPMNSGGLYTARRENGAFVIDYKTNEELRKLVPRDSMPLSG